MRVSLLPGLSELGKGRERGGGAIFIITIVDSFRMCTLSFIGLCLTLSVCLRGEEGIHAKFGNEDKCQSQKNRTLMPRRGMDTVVRLLVNWFWSSVSCVSQIQLTSEFGTLPIENRLSLKLLKQK